MLDVGVIGIGPNWESRYRPALETVRHRVRVRAVHSPVTTMAEAAAAEFRADVSPSLLSLVERSDLRALLILETAWLAEFPALLAIRAGKPVFLSQSAESDLTTVSLPPEELSVAMPELPLRYTPATQRLRELLATRLGRVRRVELELPALDPTDAFRPALVDALDWCRSLIGDCVARVASLTETRGIGLQFSRASGDSVAIEVRRAADPATASLSSLIQCERGTVSLKGSRQLAWTCDGEEQPEILMSDRGALEVMLDHFSRRVVGGLVPVPTLDDVTSARRLANLVGERWAITET